MSQVKPDLLCLSEHWLQHSDIEKLHLSDYNLISYSSRTVYRGGGTAIFCQNVVASEVSTSVQPKERVFEFCISKFNMLDSECILICVYRSPAGDTNDFLSDLDELLRGVCVARGHAVVCGDFNINFLHNSKLTDTLLQLMLSYGLKPHVVEPTRVSAVSSTLIDNIFSNIDVELMECSVLKTCMSDHYGQLLAINVSASNFPGLCKVNRRAFKEENIALFVQYMSETSWSDVLDLDGADAKYESFFETLFFWFDTAFPVGTITTNKKSKSWISREISDYSDYIKDLYVWYKETKSPLVYQQYKRERKQYRHFLSNYKKALFDSQISNSTNKSKSAWNIFNKLTNKVKQQRELTLVDSGSVLSDPGRISELFNSHFSASSTNLQFVPVSDLFQHPTIFLDPIDEREVFRLLMSLPNKFSAGLDEIPVKILKHVAHFISEPLADIINESFTTGTFPDSLKGAKVVPIYKNGEPTSVENYRPISILPSLSKIFERALYDRLYKYFSSFNIFTTHQYGFLPKKSTELAIYNTINYIMENLDNKNKVAGIYFDLSKAFDNINHELLIQKLEGYGVRGVCSRLVQSYLQNRSQCVSITSNGITHISQSRKITQGVPQGSILGPLLFIIYVNELSERVDDGMACQYADDTSVILACSTNKTLSSFCSKTLQTMEEWCAENCLRLNVEKTRLLNFDKQKQNYSLYVPCKGGSIPVDSGTKFLGVYLEPQLNWEINCKVLVSRLSSICALLRRLRDVLTLDSIRMYYISCVQPLISYSILFWGSSAGGSSSVFIAQKRIIRTIYNLKPTTSCKSYFSGFNVFTAPALYFLALVVFVKKNPELFNRNCDIYTPEMSMGTRCATDLRVPRHQSSFFEKGPFYRAIKAYNMLPRDIRRVRVAASFRERVITFLKEKQYYCFNFTK